MCNFAKLLCDYTVFKKPSRKAAKQSLSAIVLSDKRSGKLLSRGENKLRKVHALGVNYLSLLFPPRKFQTTFQKISGQKEEFMPFFFPFCVLA